MVVDAGGESKQQHLALTCMNELPTARLAAGKRLVKSAERRRKPAVLRDHLDRRDGEHAVASNAQVEQ